MSAPCRIGGLGETIAGIVHAVVVASGASSLTSAWIRWVSRPTSRRIGQLSFGPKSSAQHGVFVSS